MSSIVFKRVVVSPLEIDRVRLGLIDLEELLKYLSFVRNVKRAKEGVLAEINLRKGLTRFRDILLFRVELLDDYDIMIEAVGSTVEIRINAKLQVLFPGTTTVNLSIEISGENRRAIAGLVNKFVQELRSYLGRNGPVDRKYKPGEKEPVILRKLLERARKEVEEIRGARIEEQPEVIAETVPSVSETTPVPAAEETKPIAVKMEEAQPETPVEKPVETIVEAPKPKISIEEGSLKLADPVTIAQILFNSKLLADSKIDAFDLDVVNQLLKDKDTASYKFLYVTVKKRGTRDEAKILLDPQKNILGAHVITSSGEMFGLDALEEVKKWTNTPLLLRVWGVTTDILS
ncbi:MAG: hypothetical protein GXO43_01705 [Crenarchaeota archaeon]|nr:hypothetical protein [Thermoproteota archaeon]